MSFESIVDAELLTKDIIDPRWEESPFYMLKLMKAKQAGKRYEEIVRDIFTKLGHQVDKPESTDHDAIIDGEKVEIKGSMLTKGHDNWFSFLQIRPAQDYDKVVFMCIDFDHIRLYEMNKEEINQAIEDRIFKKQHGGNKGNSGTFCYNGPVERLNAREIK